MKTQLSKIAKVVIGCVALWGLLFNAAYAAIPIRQNLCNFSDTMLYRNGFTQGAIYPGANLNHFLSVLRVASNNSFREDVNYKASYTCEEIRGVAHGALIAEEVPATTDLTVTTRTPLVTVVRWTFTAPGRY